MGSSQRSMLEVRGSSVGGRGVFALKAIPASTILEVSPVIIVPAGQRPFLENTVLRDYYFAWGEDDSGGAMALGYGSLFNHSYDPNAQYFRDLDRAVIEFVARRDISAGEEITVNYHGDPQDTRPLWFAAKSDPTAK